jgi:hypothetical protein
MYCSSGGSEKKKRVRWGDAKTLHLISLYKELRPRVGKTQDLSNMTKLWKKITEQVNARSDDENGTHQFAVKQVQNRFASLETGYKAVIDNQKKTGRGRKTCSFFKYVLERYY